MLHTHPRAVVRALLLALLTGLLATVGAAALVVTAAPSYAAGCTKVWIGAVSTDWDNKDNWSPNTSAPGGDDTACIGGADLTVDLDSGNNHFVGGIVVGDGTHHVTLRVGHTGNVVLGLKTALRIETGSTLEVGGPAAPGSYVGRQNGADPSFVNNGTVVFQHPLTNGDPWQTPANTWDIRGMSTGAFTVASGRTDIAKDFTNTGTVTANANTLLAVSSNSSPVFDNGGAVANAGTMQVFGGGWVQRGTTTGNPITLRDQAAFDDRSGAGSFRLQAVHLTGTVPSGQTLYVGGGDGGNQVTADAPVTIAHGARVVGDLDGNGYLLTGATITNHGTITAATLANSTNGLRLGGPFVNASDGSLSLTQGRLDIVAAFTNQGSLSTATGTTTWKTGSAAFVQNGSIVNDGTFFVSGTTWNQQGGAVTGANPLWFRDQAVLNDSGGTGALFFNDVHLTGSIGAGQSVAVGGNGGGTLTLDSAASVSAGGRLVGTLDGNNFTVRGASLTNHGLVDMSSLPGEYRVLAMQSALVNATDGTVAIHSGRIDTAAQGLVNHGLVDIDPGGDLGVTQTAGPLTNAADGTLRFGISGVGSYGHVLGFGTGRLTAPAGTVAGRLVGGYAPPTGTSFAVIAAGHDAGAFGAVGGAFTAAYADGTISLVKADDPTPTPPTPTPPTPTPPTPPAPPTPVTHAAAVTVQAPHRSRPGDRVKVRTRLTDAVTHAPVAGAKVTLWKQVGASRRWVRVGTQTTSATGQAAARVTVTRTTRFRWTYAGAATSSVTLQAVTSKAATVRTAMPTRGAPAG